MKRFFTIAALMLLASCAVLKPPPRVDLAQYDYKFLLENHSRWQQSVKTLQADVRITLDSPLYSGTFNADVLRQGPDSLLVTVRGPFGMHMGKVFVNKKRFVFYNQVMNQFLTGEREDFRSRRFLQFPVSVDQLTQIISVRDRFMVLKKRVFEERDGQYYLEAENGHFRYRIWFEPATLLISRVEYFDPDTKNLSYYKTYENYTQIDGIYFPQLVNFVRPEEKEGLSLIFTGVKINRPVSAKAFLIEIDEAATQIDLDL